MWMLGWGIVPADGWPHELIKVNTQHSTRSSIKHEIFSGLYVAFVIPNPANTYHILCIILYKVNIPTTTYPTPPRACTTSPSASERSPQRSTGASSAIPGRPGSISKHQNPFKEMRLGKKHFDFNTVRILAP